MGKENFENQSNHPIAAFFLRLLLWLVTTVVILFLGIYLTVTIVCKGPSPYVRDLFVASCYESSIGYVLPKMVLSENAINNILNKNKVIESDEITDTTLINIMSDNKSDEEIIVEKESNATTTKDPDGDGIEVYDVHGSTYHGKMMIVFDPSRVKLGVIDNFDLDMGGKTIMEISEKYDAVAAINGGKYEDQMGLGIGGMPEGIVISNGQLLMGDPDTVYGVYGFTNNNVLVVGNMTASQAVMMGVRDAVTFGPALITNGKAAKFSGYGSGLNPRTAIGQRSDGAVLLLVIEGRQANSVGASYSDIVSIMSEYGAVNAANLDGGMSSSMVYNGEEIVTNCQVRTPRRIPTAFYVERRYKANE